MTPRGYIEIGAGLVLAIAFWLFVAHERSVGATAVHTADAKAMIAERRAADAQTVLNNEQAAKADAGAASEEKVITDYIAAHPIEQPVRLCQPANNRNSVLPAARAVVASTTSPGAGSAAVPQVSDGTAGPDIRPGLDAIMQASERLAELYSDRQQR